MAPQFQPNVCDRSQMCTDQTKMILLSENILMLQKAKKHNDLMCHPRSLQPKHFKRKCQMEVEEAIKLR